MELIMLPVDKKEILSSSCIVEKKQEQGDFEVVIFDPKPQEIVDRVVLEKLSEIKSTKTTKIESESLEEKKFKEALIFTDVEATIKKMGLNSDKTPRVAIGGAFDETVFFGRERQRQCFHSDNFSFDLGKQAERENKQRGIRSNIDFVFVLLSLFSSLGLLFLPVISFDFNTFGMSNPSFYLIFSLGINLIVFVVSCCLMKYYEDFFFTSFFGDNDKVVRVKTGITVKVPQIPEKALKEIRGHGPFVILFEVAKGWKKVETDPVILRIIRVRNRQFFEPVVGYETTSLERKSLTELV